MFSMASYIFILMFLVYPAVQACKHDVGGNSGWSETTDLARWASTQIFTVGDTIVFLYNSHHQVTEVTQDDYNSCNPTNPIKSYSNGITTIKLKKARPFYFIDPMPGQCQAGMKMAIEVRAKKAGKSPPTTSYVPDSSVPPKPTGYMIMSDAKRLSYGLASLLLLVNLLLRIYLEDSH